MEPEFQPKHEVLDGPFESLETGVGTLQAPLESSKTPSHRAKSTQRLLYEAEVEVIRRKLGDLESIREKLNLPRRKICQLLMIDPSAWTRWTKGAGGKSEDAPPHIYRMLQWYLALEEKYPALDVNFWLSTVARIPNQERDAATAGKLENLQREVASLSGEVVRLKDELAAQALQTARTSRLNSEIDRRSSKIRKAWLLVALALGIFFVSAVSAWYARI